MLTSFRSWLLKDWPILSRTLNICTCLCLHVSHRHHSLCQLCLKGLLLALVSRFSIRSLYFLLVHDFLLNVANDLLNHFLRRVQFSIHTVVATLKIMLSALCTHWVGGWNLMWNYWNLNLELVIEAFTTFAFHTTLLCLHQPRPLFSP